MTITEKENALLKRDLDALKEAYWALQKENGELKADIEALTRTIALMGKEGKIA